MLLISPQKAAQAIGMNCGGSSPETDDPKMLQVLNYMTPRIEGALNVESLVRGDYVDHFYLAPMPRYTGDRRVQRLRLSNGFLVKDTALVTGPDGATYETDSLPNVDLEKGIIDLYSWQRGVYSIAYTSGFEPTPALEIPDPLPDPYTPQDLDLRILQNIPTWMEAIAINVMLVWFRAGSAKPNFPKDISFGQVSLLLQREILARIYEKYMRPRVDVMFSERYEVIAPVVD